MGLSCSKQGDSAVDTAISVEDKQDALQSTDPEMYEFWRKSVDLFDRAGGGGSNGQFHLLYNKKQQQQQQQQQQSSHLQTSSLVLTSLLNNNNNNNTTEQQIPSPKQQQQPNITTRLLIRRHPVRRHEEGVSGTHIYACRLTPEEKAQQQEQRPPAVERAPPPPHSSGSSSSTSKPPTFMLRPNPSPHPGSAENSSSSYNNTTPSTVIHVDQLFSPAAMAKPPTRKVASCVTVSAEHRIYVLDTGLTKAETDHLIAVTEMAGRGQYTAYTYAKQTLGCRDHPTVAVAVQAAVHSVVAGVLELQQQINNNNNENSNDKPASRLLALDDREPHMVKYDVTRKERQRIDMHTDKSEWTFLVALSNGGGLDYSGGGTYFECLDATVHVQRGHALVFPGTLRHCGQRIHVGLRFLLVGFLVDKAPPVATPKTNHTTPTSVATGTVGSAGSGGSAAAAAAAAAVAVVSSTVDTTDPRTAPRTTKRSAAPEDGNGESGDDDEVTM